MQSSRAAQRRDGCRFADEMRGVRAETRRSVHAAAFLNTMRKTKQNSSSSSSSSAQIPLPFVFPQKTKASAVPTMEKAAEQQPDERVSRFFELFRPELAKLHRLQDATRSTCGNEYFWWRSRWGDWLETRRGSWNFERVREVDLSFKAVWLAFERTMTRAGGAMGVPDNGY